MSFSLNEVEALAKRATRGAGHTWGMAEETGKATRWLCAHGVDGCAVLAKLLEHPTVSTFFAALELTDAAHLLQDSPLFWKTIPQPVFLWPFAAMAAGQTGLRVVVVADQTVAMVGGDRLLISEKFPDVAAQVRALAGPCADVALQPVRTKTRACPDPDAWSRLGQLALQTYAPATDASRRLGAGGGLFDND